MHETRRARGLGAGPFPPPGAVVFWAPPPLPHSLIAASTTSIASFIESAFSTSASVRYNANLTSFRVRRVFSIVRLPDGWMSAGHASVTQRSDASDADFHDIAWLENRSRGQEAHISRAQNVPWLKRHDYGEFVYHLCDAPDELDSFALHDRFLIELAKVSH